MRNCQIVFQRAYPIHIFISSIGEIQFLHILFNTNYYLFFIVTQTLVSSCSLVAKSCLTLATPWTEEPGRLQSMGFSRQEYWSECHFLLKGIFLTQELKPGLLHFRQILYQLSYEGSPKNFCYYLLHR